MKKYEAPLLEETITAEKIALDASVIEVPEGGAVGGGDTGEYFPGYW